MLKIFGKRVAFGFNPNFLTAQVSGVPEGSRVQRRIMRSDAPLKIVVRTPNGISIHLAEECSTGLKLSALCGAIKHEARQ